MLPDFSCHFFKRSGQGREGRALPPSGEKRPQAQSRRGTVTARHLVATERKLPMDQWSWHCPGIKRLKSSLGERLCLPHISSCALPSSTSPFSCCWSPPAPKPPLSSPLAERVSAWLLSQANQIFPALGSNREGFPLFEASSLVNPHTEEGCSQGFVSSRHIPLNPLQLHWEGKWFRTQSWL